MPINDNPPFYPTHEPKNWKDFYVETEDYAVLSKSIAPAATSSTSAISAYTSLPDEVVKLRKALEEERIKRLEAEAKVEVAKVRLENKVENKQDDEDEIERLSKELSVTRKTISDITFFITDLAVNTSGSSSLMEQKYRNVITQINSALKQNSKSV